LLASPSLPALLCARCSISSTVPPIKARRKGGDKPGHCDDQSSPDFSLSLPHLASDSCIDTEPAAAVQEQQRQPHHNSDKSGTRRRG
ncbi:hypothetical protein BHM03_00061766, partial [Ensete ventricosum]